MTAKKYELILYGFPSGEVACTALVRLLRAMSEIARRTLSLLTTGVGSAPGPTTKWLDRAAEFCLVGLEPKEAPVLRLSARTLRETARHAIQPELFPERPAPSPDETPIDLASRAVADVQANTFGGDYVDASVLQSIGTLAKALQRERAALECISADGMGNGFKLTEETVVAVRQHELIIPSPAARILTGTIDEIGHSKQVFLLVDDDGRRMSGHLKASKSQLESLRHLWGKQATVQGMLHFKPDGTPRHVAAERIVRQVEGDRLLSKASFDLTHRDSNIRKSGTNQRSHSTPSDLIGVWPGDEPIELLMADL